MKKFRHWFFKLLTGYDLIEYEEILRFAARVSDSGDRVLKLTEQIHDDNKRILENNREIIETNQRVLDISNKTIEDCRCALLLCQEARKDETLD